MILFDVCKTLNVSTFLVEIQILICHVVRV